MFSVSRSVRRAPSSSARASAPDDILPRLRPPRLDDRPEIGVERPGGRLAGLVLARADHRLEQTRTLGRPDPEPLPVLRRHAQHLGDHDDRQGPGHSLHEIEAGRVLDVVQQRFENAADARFQVVDRLARKRLVHECPEPRVVGGVEKQHGELVRRRQHGMLPGRQGARARIVAEVPMVAQDGIDIGVAGEQPGLQQSAAMHWIPGAQGRIDGIGHLGRAGRQRVVTHPALQPLAQQLRARARSAHRLAKRQHHRLSAAGASTPSAGRVQRSLADPAALPTPRYNDAWDAD